MLESQRRAVELIGDAIRHDDLQRGDWRRQTDVVRLMFASATLIAEFEQEGRACFVDGHISHDLIREAWSSGSIKSFFNRRFHDAGLKTRRIISYECKTNRKTGGKGKSVGRLHFHGLFEMPKGWTQRQLVGRLGEIFGGSNALGQRQFHLTKPQDDKHHSHNGVQLRGALGKIAYAIKYAGATYDCLNLNDGKRSRKAPVARRVCNQLSQRLARGVPSNFNDKTVFIDNQSKATGKQAFDAWMKIAPASFDNDNSPVILTVRKDRFGV